MKATISAVIILSAVCALHAAEYHVSPSGLDLNEGSNVVEVT